MNGFITIKGLCISAEQDHGAIQIVNNVSFSLEKGKVLALIGESGSGKTTIALSLMGYTKPGCSFTGGEVWIGNDNLLNADITQLREWRGKRITYIAQSAAAAFNPSKKLIDQVIESALLHKVDTRNKLVSKAIKLFRELALPDPEGIGQRYPHEVSGGQLQRIMAAMALIVDPELVILDEPTTALDVTTQVEVLQVFRKVVQQRNVTAVYVSHDLAVVAQVADKVVVLNQGETKEINDIETVISSPSHPYTALLMDSIPQMRTHWIHEPRIATQTLETIPNPQQLEICAFIDRCPKRIDNQCSISAPSRRKIHKHSHILCHLDEASLPTQLQLSHITSTEQGKNNIHVLAPLDKKENYA